MFNFRSGYQSESQFIEVPGYDACLFPHEFYVFTGTFNSIEARNARESAKELHTRLIDDVAIVLIGSYLHINGIYRYCMRFERQLVPSETFSHIADYAQRNAAFAAERRRKLHRLLLLAKGDKLIDVQNPPDTEGLQKWLQESTSDNKFLIPFRRFQRILTDMRRAREGIFMDILGGTIIICPHVYIPSDVSVPAMFGKYYDVIKNKRVLDMGTGTGILAILAVKLGADSVIATDNNPYAVSNAKLNVQRFGFSSMIEVREPANLFDSVYGEKFDVILFNAPWIKGEPQTLYDTANYDPGFRILDGFLQNAPKYLIDNGKILLQYSDVSQRKGDNSIAHLNEMIRLNGMKIMSKQSIIRTSRVISVREQVFLFEIRVF